MIRPIRQKHRLAACTLGILVPIAFVAGIADRFPVPVVASLPPELAGFLNGLLTGGTTVWTKTDLWPNRRIVTNLRQDATGSAGIELKTDLLKPDVLVYWTPGHASTTTGLPETARLLGALGNGSPLAVPLTMRGQTGQLLLYSLADHEVVAVSKPFTL